MQKLFMQAVGTTWPRATHTQKRARTNTFTRHAHTFSCPAAVVRLLMYYRGLSTWCVRLDSAAAQQPATFMYCCSDEQPAQPAGAGDQPQIRIMWARRWGLRMKIRVYRPFLRRSTTTTAVCCPQSTYVLTAVISLLPVR